MADCGMCTLEGGLLPSCEDVSALPEPSWRHAVDGMVVSVEQAARATIPDATVRAEYVAMARALAADLVARVERGALTPREAAAQANQARNLAMESMRARTSAFGNAIARWLKQRGLTLAELEARYARDLYGRPFHDLSRAQRDRVWLHITRRAGATNSRVNAAMRAAPRAGRAFLLLSVAIAVYQVAEAEDKAREAARQGGSLGGGIAASAGVAALGGVVCGPGAPLCAAGFGLAAFVAGVAGAYGGEVLVDKLMDEGSAR